jgi:hypothetical protein
MDRLIVPGRPKASAERLQAEAIRQELTMGRLALRVLAIMLSKEKGRKVAIKKEAWNRLAEKLPGALFRFGEGAARPMVLLATPEELDAADRHVAEITKARQDTVAEVAEDLEERARASSGEGSSDGR